MDLRLLLMAAGAGAAVWSMLHWRQALQLVMVLLVVEGAIRKWLFPSAQDLVYLGKDVLLVGIYLGFLRARLTMRYRPPGLNLLYSGLAAGAVFGLLEIFNPNLPNLLVGAFGFKAYFLYVPILFVMPSAFPSDRELLRSPASLEALRAGAAAHLAKHRSEPVARRYLEALAAGLARPASALGG